MRVHSTHPHPYDIHGDDDPAAFSTGDEAALHRTAPRNPDAHIDLNTVRFPFSRSRKPSSVLFAPAELHGLGKRGLPISDPQRRVKLGAHGCGPQMDVSDRDDKRFKREADVAVNCNRVN